MFLFIPYQKWEILKLLDPLPFTVTVLMMIYLLKILILNIVLENKFPTDSLCETQSF